MAMDWPVADGWMRRNHRPDFMFTAKKPTTTVGLDIEAGSIAATEVKGGDARSVARTAISPLPPGVVSEGEVQDPAVLSDELRRLFSENKLGKTSASASPTSASSFAPFACR